MIKVKKRNGELVDFNKNKIEVAINKAFLETDGLANEEIAVEIADLIKHQASLTTEDYLTVEEIQDYVETYLNLYGCYDVGKSYIKYRYLHNLARKKYSELMEAVTEKLKASNTQQQNANVDEKSFGGRVGEASDLVMKKYALDYCISEKGRNRHLNNEIYIHDLNSYAVGSHNCLSIPFDDLLANGFNTRQTDVRPANSVNTAFQLVAVIFQLQSLQQFGGVSATHLDWTMVPYVRKSFAKYYREGLKWIEGKEEIDYEIEHMLSDPTVYSIEDPEYKAYSNSSYEYALAMTKREIYQAAEALYHNLNTLQSRSGNQLPFTSINYGTCTLTEGRMIIKALLEVSIRGIGKLHKTSIFPCGIFQMMKGVNRESGDPNYDLYQLALKSTAQRLYPNYANVDWSGNVGYDKNDPRTYYSSMGCRTFNGYDINGLGQLKDGRGNICPVTIIMPTLAMEIVEQVEQAHQYDSMSITNSEYIDAFFKLLDEAINDAKDMLIERFDWICSQSPDSAKFMYENNVMAGYVPEEGIRSALKHGTLAVG